MWPRSVSVTGFVRTCLNQKHPSSSRHFWVRPVCTCKNKSTFHLTCPRHGLLLLTSNLNSIHLLPCSQLSEIRKSHLEGATYVNERNTCRVGLNTHHRGVSSQRPAAEHWALFSAQRSCPGTEIFLLSSRKQTPTR